MPTIALVAVGTLHKDRTVTEALCKHLSPNVVQPHAPSWREKREKIFTQLSMPSTNIKGRSDQGPCGPSDVK